MGAIVGTLADSGGALPHYSVVAVTPGDPPGGAHMTTAADSLGGSVLNGLTLPLTFNEGQTAPEVVCYWPVVVKDGRWSSPTNGQRTCR